MRLRYPFGGNKRLRQYEAFGFYITVFSDACVLARWN